MHDVLNRDPELSKDLVGGFNNALLESHDKLKAAGKLGSFWYDEVSPFLSEWQRFQEDHSHWYDLGKQIATNAEVYQTWQDRLNKLRAKAVSLHIKLPADTALLPKPTSLGDTAKTIGLAALGIGTAIAIIEVAKR